jgi:Zn-dependent protease with chaperone function
MSDRLPGHGASFNDGATAARRAVVVELAPDGLRILEREGGEIARWPYDALRHRDEVFAGGPLQIKAAGGEARLMLDDGALLATLVERAPQLAVAHGGIGRRAVKWAGLSLLAMAVLAGALWVVLPRVAHLVAAVIPVSWERALGDQVFEQIGDVFAHLEGEEEVKICTGNPAARRVLDKLSGRLAAAAGSPYDFRIAVFDLKTPNAFALPGGQIVVLRGLLDFAESPDELSGVLAHEMGHVIHRHGTERIVHALGLTFFFGVMLGDLGSGSIGLLGETLVSNAFSREAETEADRSALETLGRAELAPGGLIAFFERLKQVHGDVPALLAVLSTHPRHDDRLAMFARAPAGGAPVLSESDWQVLKGICGE